MTAPADTAVRPSPAPPVPPAPGLRDAFGLLLHLSEQDRAGLTWTKHRARFWLTALKRRRKYLPRGAGYTPEESELIGLLAGLEDSAGRLLEIAEGKEVF